jgi:hypothetical protein
MYIQRTVLVSPFIRFLLYYYSFIHSFINGSTALFVGPGPLLQVRYLFTQTVGLPGRVISPSQDLYLYTGQYTEKRIHKHPYLEDLNLGSQRPSEQRQYFVVTTRGKQLTKKIKNLSDTNPFQFLPS